MIPTYILRSVAAMIFLLVSPIASADLGYYLFGESKPTIGEAYDYCYSKTPTSINGSNNQNYVFLGCAAGNDSHGSPAIVGRAEWYSAYWGQVYASSFTTYSTGCASGRSWDFVTKSCELPGAKAELNVGNETCPDGTPSNMCGNPINTATGNKFQQEMDITPVGLLEFRRFYNSASAVAGDLLGQRWTHTYSRQVRMRSYVDADVLRPDGRIYSFSKTAGVWKAVDGLTASFSQRVDASGVSLGWRFQEVDAREIEEFDTKGRLRRIIHADVESVELVYNGDVESGTSADLQLTKVTSQDGRGLSFGYDESGRISLVTMTDGRAFAYAYDSSGMLHSVTYPDGKSRTYLYTESAFTSGAMLPSALTGILDEASNRFASFSYYADGRAKSTEHAAGVEKFVAVYNVDGSSTITEPLGATQTRSFATISGKVRATSISRTDGSKVSTSSFQYDPNGRTDMATDAIGTITDYDFDARGLLTRRVDAANAPTLKRTIETDWHSQFSVPQERRIRDQNGVVVSKTTWTYNARGQVLTATQHHLTDPSLSRTTTFTYCDQIDTGPVQTPAACPFGGLLRSVDGPRTDTSDITSFVYYDDDGCSYHGSFCYHRKGDLSRVTNARGQVTQYQSYNERGQPTQIMDANGVVTSLEYSPRGWLTARKLRGLDDSSEVDDAITRLDYDPTGDVSKLTLPDGSFVSFAYDAAHRLTEVTDALGNTIRYTLDNAGHRVAEATRDAGGTTRTSVSRIFDAFGQLKTLADGYSTPTDFTYDLNGDLNTVTDPLLRVSDRDTDALGRLTRQIANTGGTASDRATSQFKYGTQDNLVEVIDPKGLSTTYAYNELGDLTQLSSPDTGATTYSYNNAGERTGQVDARAQATSYTYDALGRLTGQRVPTANQNVYFDFDTDNPSALKDPPLTDCVAGETYGMGRLGGLRDESGTTHYCYDRRGNLVRKAQTVVGGSKLTVGATFDGADHLIALTYPSGAIVSYLRNGNGQISRVDAVPKAATAQVVLLNNASYLPFGPLTTFTFGNGRSLTKAYDQNYGVDKVSDSAASNPISQDFSLNAVGNVTGLVERTSTATPLTRTYSYDGLDRLTGEKDGARVVEAYAYDATGNRLSKTVGNKTTAYTFPVSSHRLTAVGTTTRSYDNLGNTTLIGSGNSAPGFVYDERNRLRDYKVGATIKASYRYNGKGEQVLRIDSTTAASSRQYVYDEAGHLLGEYTTAGVRIQEYVWLDDTLVGILSDHDGSTYQYVETDHLGTPRAVIHPSKNTIIWRWNINDTGFGDHAPIADPDNNGLSYNLTLRYPGQRADPISGMNYNYFRDYDAGTGRYVESDPIGLGGGASTYGYVSGSPLGGTDPQGLFLSSIQAACMQDPAFCLELMGGLAHSRAAIARKQCDAQAADYFDAAGGVFEAAERPAMAAVLTSIVLMPAIEVARGLARPNAYSVAFEATIGKTGAGTREAHKVLANREVASAMSDSGFGHVLSSLGVSPVGGARTPEGFRWHHAVDRPGVMQLVPENQHTSGSIFQDLLHPGGRGGFAQWGREW